MVIPPPGGGFLSFLRFVSDNFSLLLQVVRPMRLPPCSTASSSSAPRTIDLMGARRPSDINIAALISPRSLAQPGAGNDLDDDMDLDCARWVVRESASKLNSALLGLQDARVVQGRLAMTLRSAIGELQDTIADNVVKPFEDVTSLRRPKSTAQAQIRHTVSDEPARRPSTAPSAPAGPAPSAKSPRIASARRASTTVSRLMPPSRRSSLNSSQPAPPAPTRAFEDSPDRHSLSESRQSDGSSGQQKKLTSFDAPKPSPMPSVAASEPAPLLLADGQILWLLSDASDPGDRFRGRLGPKSPGVVNGLLIIPTAGEAQVNISYDQISQNVLPWRPACEGWWHMQTVLSDAELLRNACNLDADLEAVALEWQQVQSSRFPDDLLQKIERSGKWQAMKEEMAQRFKKEPANREVSKALFRKTRDSLDKLVLMLGQDGRKGSPSSIRSKQDAAHTAQSAQEEPSSPSESPPRKTLPMLVRQSSSLGGTRASAALSSDIGDWDDLEAIRAHQAMQIEARQLELELERLQRKTPDEMSALTKSVQNELEKRLGKELKNTALAKALQSKTRFTREEWEVFGVDDLSVGAFTKSGAYIRSGDMYFQPAALDEIKTRVRINLKQRLKALYLLTDRLASALEGLDNDNDESFSNKKKVNKEKVQMPSLVVDGELADFWMQRMEKLKVGGIIGLRRYCAHQSLFLRLDIDESISQKAVSWADVEVIECKASDKHLLQIKGGQKLELELHPWNHAPCQLPASAFDELRRWHLNQCKSRCRPPQAFVEAHTPSFVHFLQCDQSTHIS